VVLLAVPLTLFVVHLVFVLVGLGNGGFMMGMNNLTLEFGTLGDRARRIAVSNIAATSTRGTAPLVGGILADVLGYRAVFSVSLCLIIIAIFILYRTVQEPRHQNSI
jgi:MFS family permease